MTIANIPILYHFTDLRNVAEPRIAKRDARLQESGKLIGFEFEEFSFPITPKTAFYDWLYITAIFPHREWLSRYTDTLPSRILNSILDIQLIAKRDPALSF
jgi:hypothetical protein